MNFLPTMSACFAMIAFAAVGTASALSFLQVEHQRGAALLDFTGKPPVHLLDLPAEEMDANLGPSNKDLKAKGIFFWNLCDAQVHSNLGGLGPDSGAQELRFMNIGKYGGKSVDLVFVNFTEYKAWDVHRNTARGCFAVINVKHDHAVGLNASFVEGGTDIPMVWKSHFSFSVFDADCSENGCEEVKVRVPEEDIDDVCVDDNNELHMAVQQYGNFVEEDFEASHLGEGSDNPPPLGSVQLDRAVTWDLATVGGFQMKLQVHKSNQGRNFLFAGATKICEMRHPSPPPTPAPDCVSGQCTIWGDPHIITFDVSAKRKKQHPAQEAFFRTRGWKSDQLSIYDEGTFWLVRSQRVHIQARYWHNKTHPDWTNLGALAIGGPFLENNTLIIRPLESASTWNGKEILATLPSKFSNKYIRAQYRRDAERVQDGTSGPGIEMELPDGVSLTVNRWMQSLAAKIVMCSQTDGQEGQCGNFNGYDKDDIDEAMEPHGAHRVPKSAWLF